MDARDVEQLGIQTTRLTAEFQRLLFQTEGIHLLACGQTEHHDRIRFAQNDDSPSLTFFLGLEISETWQTDGLMLREACLQFAWCRRKIEPRVPK